MSVYVDAMTPCLRSERWPYRTSCHLFANTLAELHEAADRIGLKRVWFQGHPRLPHYDLTAAKRVAAIRAGATGVGREFLVDFMRRKSEVTT